MAFPLHFSLTLCIFFASFHGFLADPSICSRPNLDSIIADVRSQCPLSITQFPPEEVSGDNLDRELGNTRTSAYHSVFFYASWCPFSSKTRPIFDALSSMFPQIRHLAMEESSTMPSVFSRYGIHSFPSIMIANGETRMQYHGPKDLNTLVNFYKETTGLDPVAYFSVEQPSNSENETPLNLWDRSPMETIKSEPYLAFSLIFIILKVFITLFPVIVVRLKAFLATCRLQLTLEIFGEWSHLLDRVLHIIDLKKFWSKLHLSNKTRNFRKGATNARVNPLL